jgi:hypothetical protein
MSPDRCRLVLPRPRCSHFVTVSMKILYHLEGVPDGGRGRYGGRGRVSVRDGFRLSVRGRERDRRLGGLSPGPAVPVEGNWWVRVRPRRGRRSGQRHRITDKRGSGRLLLPFSSGSSWGGRLPSVVTRGPSRVGERTLVHWPGWGVPFVDANGEPPCLFTVVTRRGWCGSGLTLRWSRSTRCLRVTEADGGIRVDRFHVQPTLAGLATLTGRLAKMPGVVAVAELTSMTWLALSVALADAGCGLSLLGRATPPGCAGRSAASLRAM